ncbi:hypothetical protein [Pseudomonas putida]
MSIAIVKIEISWPADLQVPAGSTANVQMWVGNESASYRMISDGDLSVPAETSPATVEFSYDPADLIPDDSSVTWGYFHTSPYLMHDGKRLNIERTAKISIDDAMQSGWQITIS